MFAMAAHAAGTRRSTVDCGSVADVVSQLTVRYGEGFATVMRSSRVWLNGEPTSMESTVSCRPGDEVAILPPVSGG